MNPPSPREELEIRITAMLMGELPPDEAAVLQTQIAADAELSALHAQLRHAAELLREASAIPEQPAPPVPARLSDERRARLLAHFKGGTRPGPVIVKPRRDWKWAVPLGLAASLMALIGGAMYVNGFALRKGSTVAALDRSDSDGERLALQSDTLRSWGEKREAGVRQRGETDELRDVAKATQNPRFSDGAFAGRADEGSTMPNAPAISEPNSDHARSALAAGARAPELELAGRPRVAGGGTVGTGSVYLPAAAAGVSRADFDAGLGNFPDGTAEGGVVSADAEKSAPGGGPAFVAGSFWDTPRVRTHFDRGTSGPTATFRGGLASSQPIANDLQRYPRETGARSPDAPGNGDQNRPFDAAPTGGDVSKFPKVAGGGGEAVKEAGEKASTTDLNGHSATVGGLAKNGNGTLTLSSANAYAGGTTISGGTLHGWTAGGTGGGAKPGAQPTDPRDPGKPATEDHFASYKTEVEPRVDLGTAHREPGVVALKGGTTFSIPIHPAEDPNTGEKRPVTQESLDLAVKDLRDGVEKAAIKAKPATTSLGLVLGGLEQRAAELGEKADVAGSKDALARGEVSGKRQTLNFAEGEKGDTNGRSENKAGIAAAAPPASATPLPGVAWGNQPASPAIFLGTEHKLGDVRVDYGVPLKETARSSSGDAKFQFNVGDKIERAASEDGRKAALNPNVTEFEGFINYGGAIAGKPAGAPLPALPSASTPLVLNGGGIVSGSNASGGVNAEGTRWLEVTRNGTLVNPAANATDGARRSDDNPVVGRIAFWADDDTAKVNVNTAGGAVLPDVPADWAKQPHFFADVNQPADIPQGRSDFGTVSGVIAGTGGVTLDKSGAGNWNISGANAFTGGTTVNAGTLTVTGGTSANVAGIAATNASNAFGVTAGGKAITTAPTGSSVTSGGAGNAATTFSGVITKSGQSALVEKGRGFNDQVELQAPEVPRNLDATGTGTLSKAGDGTLILNASGTTFGGGISMTNGTVYLGAGSINAVQDSKPKASPAGRAIAEKAKESGAVASADAEGTYSKAKVVKLNEELQEAASRVSVEKTAGRKSKVEQQVAEAKTESDLRQLLAVEENLGRQKRAEALGEREIDGLQAKSDRPLLGDVPSTGKMFRSGLAASQPAAPAEGIAEAPKQVMKESPRDEKESVALLQSEERKNPGAAEKSRKPNRAQPERMEKKLAESAEVESDKTVAKEVLRIISEAEPAAPKSAPNPLVPQPEIRTGANAFSTFSLNVSDVAFKLAGASLEHGTMPDVSTLRSEEFINAFDYRDPEPAAGAPLGFVSERARYPFAQNRDLLRLSVKTAAAGRQPGRPLNIVLLLDNSGSMERADRVRILREAMRLLSAQLQPQDKLSIVTFSRTPRLWADGVTGDKAGEVTARVGEITPEGGTNLAAALDLGYTTALRHYQAGSINHVVVLTDGAANLGNVDPAALKQKVEAHRKQGVALDCFGIGWEGLNDDMLEQLSRNGDGRYGFINTPEEAATNFAGQLAGALRVAASDVKVQVEWNPKRVTAYRQVGYAKHQLTKEQFRDNTVDAAEIGAAESGNALYVVEVNPRGEGDLATVRVRFKVPGTSDYREHEWTVPFTGNAAPLEQSSSTLRLAATASAFSEMLASSPFATEVTSDRLLGLLNGVPAIYNADPRPKKLEWMIRQAKSLSGR